MPPDHHTGAIFLHQRNPNLHAAPPVELLLEQARRAGERIPNEPAAKIEHYMGVLGIRHSMWSPDAEVRRKTLTTSRIINRHVIRSEEVPEGYVSKVAAREGVEDGEMSEHLKRELTERAQDTQYDSLEDWIDYLNYPPADYPMWFKYYVFDSVSRLAGFNKKKAKFSKRSRSTMSGYPDLNVKALRQVYDAVQRHIDGPPDTSEESGAASFTELYRIAYMNSALLTPELKQQTEGEWTCFERDGSYGAAKELKYALVGYGTNWCTTGLGDAHDQLSQGDFHVYRTRDAEGEMSIPRIAIRVHEGGELEIRGVEAGQNMEDEMLNILEAKLRALPGGAEHIGTIKSCRQLSMLYEAMLSGRPYTEDELALLYGLDGHIHGFGLDPDERLDKIISSRNVIADLEYLLDTQDHNEIAEALIESYSCSVLLEHLEEFDRLDHDAVANWLLDYGLEDPLLTFIYKFKGLRSDTAKRLLQGSMADFVVNFLDSFRNLDDEVVSILVDEGHRESLTMFPNSFACFAGDLE